MQDVTARSIDWTLGDTQYNRLKLAVSSAAYLEDVNHVDQEEFAGWDLMYQLTSWSLIWD